jgi:hypothetical protein
MEIAAAQLRLVTDRRLGKQTPEWVKALADEKPRSPLHRPGRYSPSDSTKSKCGAATGVHSRHSTSRLSKDCFFAWKYVTVRAVSTRRTNVLCRPAWSSSSAENPDYPDVVVPELSELTIWGVVTRCLHHV